MAAKTPTMNGALGMALDALRDELDLSVEDLAARTPYGESELSETLLGNIPIPDGHGSACLRAMADVMEYRTAVAVAASA